MRRLTPRETAIVVVAAVLALALPLYQFVFAPEVDALRMIDGRIVGDTRQLSSVDADARRLPQVERAHAAEAARVHQLEQGLPTSISVSSVVGWLSAAIAGSGVQLIEVTFPAGTQPSASTGGVLQELLFTVKLRGTFPRLVAFLRQLETPPVLASEQTLSVAGGGPKGADGEQVLEMTVTMKAFALR